jgi:hypothetical protein
MSILLKLYKFLAGREARLGNSVEPIDGVAAPGEALWAGS